MENAYEDKTSLKIASFSCYLDTNKENSLHKVPSQDNFVFNVPKSIQDPTPPLTFSQETPKDAKISIFGADKYFNMKMEIKPDLKEEAPIQPVRPRAQSLHSESSHNSQTALLQNGISQTKQKKAVRRFFIGFVCKGACFDKKAVQVKKEIANTEDSRDSIEVFGSKTTSKGEVATNMERKLSMLTWDAIPKAQNLQTPTVGSSTVCDDMASEASSDLFEIENISRSMYPTLTSNDHDMSICTSPTSQYAPSEASIQWSVVTASAADYSSVLSDNYNDEETTRERSGKKNTSAKSKNGGILGCKSHNAVDVTENYMCNEKGENQGLDLSVPLGKLQACSRSKVKESGPGFV